MSARRRLPVRRDSLLFGLGALGIGYQQVTERYYLPLMVLYGLMVGVPGLAQLITAFRGLATAPAATTADEPSSTPSSQGQPPQPQSSTSAS